MTRPWALCLVAMIAGCAGSYPTARPAEPAARASQPGAGEPGEIDITRASMPFQVLRARGGQELTAEAFFDELAAAEAICLGESHTNPHHHWVQLRVVEEMTGRRGDRVMALGLEMFQRPFQGVLDDYAAGRIDEQALLVRTGWAERWGHDFALYRPIVSAAVASGMALVALNIANELRRKVSRGGIDSLTDAERAELPEIDLDDKEHRAWFEEVMAAMGAAHGHGGHPAPASGHGAHPAPGHGHGAPEGSTPGDGAPEGSAPGDSTSGAHKSHGHHHHGAHVAPNLYLAQVLWDETMAEAATRWLAGGARRQMVILAGNGHCHETAIVRRMKRRGAGKVVSVRPIIDDGQGNVAAELARPLADYLFVMTPPR